VRARREVEAELDALGGLLHRHRLAVQRRGHLDPTLRYGELRMATDAYSAASPTRRWPAPTPRQKRLTLIACITGSAVVFIDGTVVNVALPAIREDLDAGLAAQQWVVEGYLLTLASLILIGGSLSDLFGRRRIFALGTALFGITSLLCAIAPTEEALVAARVVQGAAGALLVPSTLATIMAVFPEEERGRAIGTWTAWSGVSTVIGPLAGGALVDVASWRWVFGIGLVPIAITLYLVLRELPACMDARPAERPRVDWLGALLCALGLAGPVFALIEQPSRGWGDPLVIGPLAAGLVLLALFVLQERRTPDPMLPLDLFRRHNFTVGNAATLLVYGGLGAAILFLVLFLQETAGYSAFEAGLALLPMTMILFVLSSRVGALADRLGPRLFMGGGPIVGGVGLLLLIMADASADYVTQVLPGVSLFGLGLALTVAPLTATVLSDADQRHAGVASGVNNAVARVAGLLAIAVVGAIVSAQFIKEVDDGLGDRPLSPAARQAVDDAKARPLTTSSADDAPPSAQTVLRETFEDASVSSFRVGIGVSGALVILGGVISAVGIRNPRRKVAAAECPGGAICGASEDVGRGEPEAAHVEAPEPAAV
jgi:EmrB/QacA subfamily drug resistance transporter